MLLPEMEKRQGKEPCEAPVCGQQNLDRFLPVLLPKQFLGTGPT